MERAKALSRLQDPPHLPALARLLLVVYDRPLRHRCGQSQQTSHRIQPAHVGLHPPVGALASLARRDAPACQLLQPISDLLSPRGHPSFRLYLSVRCCCLTVVSSPGYADAFDNRKLAPACLRQEMDRNS